MRAVGTVGEPDSPQEWYSNLPIITKFVLTSTLLTAALTTFKLLNPMQLIFSWPLIWHDFQIWRIVTPLLFAGGFSFNFLMHCYILYQNFIRYENNPYNTGAGGTSADFLWMCLLGLPFLLLSASLFDFFILSEPFLYYVMYVLSRRDLDGVMSFFGFKFKTLYLPWVYMGFRLLMGGSIIAPLVGVVIGHVYYFLHIEMPAAYGRELLPKTPQFCIDVIAFATSKTQPRSHVYVPPQAGAGAAGGAAAFRPAAGAAAGNTNVGYNWGGRGRVLGTQ